MSVPGPNIRRADSRDARRLAELGAVTFTQTFGHLYSDADLQTFLSQSRSMERYAAMLDNPAIGIWLAELPGAAPIGYAVAGACKLPVPDLEPTAGEVQELYVRAGHQGLQLGTRLLNVALEWLETRGCRPLYIGVWSENFGAQRFYGRLGFTRIGEYGFAVGDHIDQEFILRRA
jgi:ribosomal protein S18 acetylase RimI-like enzyme